MRVWQWFWHQCVQLKRCRLKQNSSNFICIHPCTASDFTCPTYSETSPKKMDGTPFQPTRTETHRASCFDPRRMPTPKWPVPLWTSDVERCRPKLATTPGTQRLQTIARFQRDEITDQLVWTRESEEHPGLDDGFHGFLMFCSCFFLRVVAKLLDLIPGCADSSRHFLRGLDRVDAWCSKLLLPVGESWRKVR